MLTYSAERLRTLAYNRPPSRTVRKAIFKFKLWWPRHPRTLFGHADKHEQPTTKCKSHINVGWLNVRSLVNKTTAVHDAIDERKLDILALTEVWHHSSDDICLRQAAPSGYACVDAVRERSPGHGGIAVLHGAWLKCTRVELPPSPTLEALCLRFTAGNRTWLMLTIYRPGSSPPTGAFLDDLTNILEVLTPYGCPLIIGGDMNVHIEDETNAVSRQYLELLDSRNMRQHIEKPTHIAGGILDHVITNCDFGVDDLNVDPPGIFADHSLITGRISIVHRGPAPSPRVVRSWKSVDRNELLRAIGDSPLGIVPTDDTSAEQLFSVYDDTLRNLADRLAPQHKVLSQRRPLCPWFDAECRAARRKCRRLERRYRRTHEAADKELYIAACKEKQKTMTDRKTTYWTNRVEMESSEPTRLWRSLSTLLEKDRRLADNAAPSRNTAEDFLRYFEDKVSNVRASTEGAPKTELRRVSSPSPRNELSILKPCTEEEVRRLIMESPTKSCALDPIPTFLLKEILDGLLPYITAMINASLKEGCLPESQKHAIVTPILKKPGLNPDDPKNYRPVSNLTFISKIVEKAVIERVLGFIEDEKLLPRLQSAYRRHHGTETALLKVLADILEATDRKQITLLGLLDLSAAFDCVDHGILLRRLEEKCGIKGCALSWFTSFLTGRTQKVLYRGLLSKTTKLLHGVPQGSVCGPVLFLLYVAEVFDIIAACGMVGHGYADDIQIYCSGPASEEAILMHQLGDCIVKIRAWMAGNRLKLNEDKTQLIWLGTRQQLNKVSVMVMRLPNATVECSTVVNNLGVLIDGQLSMVNHVTAMSKKAFFQLRQLRAIRKSLTPEACRTLAQAFVNSRLDYCNSILYGVSDYLLQRLQSVQNAAARLVTQAGKYDHISPALRELHWLPIRQRVKFKVGTIAFKAQRSLTPPYLCEMFRSTAEHPGRKGLRSAAAGTLDVPPTRTKYGDRSLAVAGPSFWNALPTPLRLTGSTQSLLSFRKKLKTFLFNS